MSAAGAGVHVEATADSRFGTNSYLVEDEATKDAVIIDANLEPEAMVELVRRRGAKVKALLLTHTDVDHIAGVPRLRQEYPEARLAVHPSERPVLTEGRSLRDGSLEFELPPVAEVDDLEEGRAYQAGSLEFRVLHTPGHSPGGVSLEIGNVIFTGDALFAGSIGRTDLKGGDGPMLLAAIRAKLLDHADEFLVFSGHGPVTTVGQERRYNPFL